MGILLVLVGVFLNKWSIQWLFAVDKDVSSIPKLAAIGIFQLACIAGGLWFVFKRPIRSISISLSGVTTIGLVVGILIGGYGSLGAFSFNSSEMEWVAADSVAVLQQIFPESSVPAGQGDTAAQEAVALGRRSGSLGFSRYVVYEAPQEGGVVLALVEGPPGEQVRSSRAVVRGSTKYSRFV